MSLPMGFRFSKEHTWLDLTTENEAIIGISDFAQSELGEIVYADLPAVGATFKKDEVFGSIEALKTTSDLFMPVSGQITAINEALKAEPALVNSHAFSEGWLIKIKLLNIEEVKDTMTGEDYLNFTV